MRAAGGGQAGINNFQSQVFLPDSVCLVVSLALPDCESTVAKGKELLPQLPALSNAGQGSGLSILLLHPASQLYVHLQLTFLTPHSPEFLLFQLSIQGSPLNTFQNVFAIFCSNILDVTRDAALSQNCSLHTFAWIKSDIGRNPL